MKEGIFRILANDKIGFANTSGEVVIKPQFCCAFPFSNDRAKVAYEGYSEQIKGSEYSSWIAEDWFYVDLKGRRIVEK